MTHQRLVNRVRLKILEFQMWILKALHRMQNTFSVWPSARLIRQITLNQPIEWHLKSCFRRPHRFSICWPNQGQIQSQVNPFPQVTNLIPHRDFETNQKNCFQNKLSLIFACRTPHRFWRQRLPLNPILSAITPV